MNGDRFFLDTNVFVYCFEPSEPVKASLARNLVALAAASGQGVISYQVAQEFCNLALRKAQSPLRVSNAREYVRDVLGQLNVVQSSLELLDEGLRLYERYRLSWYDALIVAAAQQARCAILYSEDFQHGAQFEGVRVVDPFR